MKLINTGNSDLFRFIIVITLMMLMILFIVKAYLANKPAVDSVNYAMQQKNFTRTLSLIRGQWLLEGRPKEVEFAFYDNSNNVINISTFKLSKSGWASINDRLQPEYCTALWATILNVDPKTVSRSTFIEAKPAKSDDIVCQICDAEQQACFEYSIKTGLAYQ